MKIQNPHDKFFKETFSNVEVAKDFIRNYLPQSIVEIIDMKTMQPQKDSFINEELQEVFSDMLFRVNINKNEGYLYILFEHKSYKSKDIAFQLLRYMLEIWETKVKKEKTDELPIIIPLVIYHGKDRWEVKRSLGESISGFSNLPKEVRQYIPNYEFLFYDISQFTDDEIKGEVELRVLFSIFRDIFTKDNKELQESIYKAAILLLELESKSTGIEYFETFIRYVLNAGHNLTKEDVDEIIEKIGNSHPEGGEFIMSIAEKLKQEGREEGIIKGMEAGIEKGAKQRAVDVARRLLKMNLQIDQIVDATGLTKKEVEKMATEMEN